MPNDPVQDGHFKSNTNMSEWDEVVFDDLPEMELFWLKPGRQYPAYRKMDDGSIQNTKTREHSTLGAKIKVFVRS